MNYDPTINSGYLNQAFSTQFLPKIVSQAAKFLGRRRDSFDSIVVRGVSGMLVGAPLAYRMKLPLVVVRKEDGNHSGRSVEGYSLVKNYVVIDDFVASGDTINTIRAKLSEYNWPPPKMVGLVTYTANDTSSYIYKTFASQWNCWIKMVGRGKGIYKP